MGLSPVAVVKKLVYKYKRENYIYDKKQYIKQYKNRTHKIENKNISYQKNKKKRKQT